MDSLSPSELREKLRALRSQVLTGGLRDGSSLAIPIQPQPFSLERDLLEAAVDACINDTEISPAKHTRVGAAVLSRKGHIYWAGNKNEEDPRDTSLSLMKRCGEMRAIAAGSNPSQEGKEFAIAAVAVVKLWRPNGHELTDLPGTEADKMATQYASLGPCDTCEADIEHHLRTESERNMLRLGVGPNGEDPWTSPTLLPFLIAEIDAHHQVHNVVLTTLSIIRRLKTHQHIGCTDIHLRDIGADPGNEGALTMLGGPDSGLDF